MHGSLSEQIRGFRALRSTYDSLGEQPPVATFVEPGFGAFRAIIDLVGTVEAVRIAKRTGFCYGVREAIDKAKEASAAGKTTHTLGQVVHNEGVVRDLLTLGIETVETLDDVDRGGPVGQPVVALLLACLGLYGTISYGVARRVTELGVRMALGADRANVLWLVVREALMLVLIGGVFVLEALSVIIQVLTFKFLGRRIDSDTVYTEFEPNRKLTFEATTPFPMTIAFTFESVPGETRVHQVVDAEPGGFFKLAGPLLVAAAKRQFQNDLDNFRDLMEADALAD